MKQLPRMPMKLKKQIGVRLRPELIDTLDEYIKHLHRKGIFMSKNDVIESLIHTLNEELENGK